MIAEAWLRGGMLRLRARRRPPAQAGDHHRPSVDPDATLMARGDSAFGTKKVIGACLDEQVESDQGGRARGHIPRAHQR